MRECHPPDVPLIRAISDNGHLCQAAQRRDLRLPWLMLNVQLAVRFVLVRLQPGSVSGTDLALYASGGT